MEKNIWRCDVMNSNDIEKLKFIEEHFGMSVSAFEYVIKEFIEKFEKLIERLENIEITN